MDIEVYKNDIRIADLEIVGYGRGYASHGPDNPGFTEWFVDGYVTDLDGNQIDIDYVSSGLNLFIRYGTTIADGDVITWTTHDSDPDGWDPYGIASSQNAYVDCVQSQSPPGYPDYTEPCTDASANALFLQAINAWGYAFDLDDLQDPNQPAPDFGAQPGGGEAKGAGLPATWMVMGTKTHKTRLCGESTL